MCDALHSAPHEISGQFPRQASATAGPPQRRTFAKHVSKRIAAKISLCTFDMRVLDSRLPDDPESSAWATFIGIIICLCGNVVISFALNIQRLAHERIERRLAQTNGQRTSREDVESYGSQLAVVPHPAKDSASAEEGTLYLKSKLWWTGLVLMVIGELGNFIACTHRLFYVSSDRRRICSCVDCCSPWDGGYSG